MRRKRERLNETCQLTKYLWVGSAKEARTLSGQYHFDYIVNVSREPDDLYKGAQMRYLPMYDLANLSDKKKIEETRQTMIHVVNLLLEITGQGKTVFLHCQQGQSRSISVAIAYIMTAFDKSSSEAQEYVFYHRRLASVKKELLVIVEAAAKSLTRGENEIRDELFLYDEAVDAKKYICHYCLDPALYHEDGSHLKFCDQHCQIAYHLISGQNPLEFKDTIFSILLQVPPSKLYRLYNVSRKFRRILREDNSFKVAYLKQWEISDEFYMRCKYFQIMNDWLPYLGAYHGFFTRNGNRNEVFTGAVINERLDIMKIMLENLDIESFVIRWSIRVVIQHDLNYDAIDYLRELFKYGNPSNQDLEDAITQQLGPDVVELILSTGAITDVDNAIRWAGIHANAPLVQRLYAYQETLTAREGVLKKARK